MIKALAGGDKPRPYPGKHVLVAWGPVVSGQFNDTVKKSFEENDLVLIIFKFSGECD